jgi:hypothetical protein
MTHFFFADPRINEEDKERFRYDVLLALLVQKYKC